ncbi:M20/M25/M40 family metallo-hydrolase [Solitalea lacus]|uniref:M20/M25/M40 family metallo-hydrolase n=1 Tax=Solitalea lacus TaxID=2911172 RepID=UPI001EDADA3D|nr:M20/M25/M40 family metallo-hydrolase [Solitalea lacus]UKJ06076.1 M20/M25/M40 family metallo-hydrolase [Solitalea lacus]
MKKVYKLSFYLFVASISSAFAQDEKIDFDVIEKIRNEGLNNSQVMDIAFYLTDVSGPRLSNSNGLKNAQNWAIAQFKQWGLLNPHKEAWGDFGRGWEIEKSYIAMTKPYYQQLLGTPRAWTNGTNKSIKGSVELVKFKSDSDFVNYAGKLKNKIVIMDIPSSIKTGFEADAKRYTDEDLVKMASYSDENPAKKDTFSPKQIQEFRARGAMMGKFREFCLTEGAALVISNGRGNNGTYFTSNGAPYAVDAKPVVPEMEITAEHYMRMIRLLKANIPVELEIDTKTRFVDEDVKGYNVIAEIPGTDPKLKNEVVMLGAHIDSWFAATGATDNAAGTAVVMETVRIIKALNLKPKRTIRIALWSSEEQGLFGSRGYVKQHFGDKATMALLPEHEKLSAYYNLDNGTGKIRGIYTQGNKDVKPIFEQWFTPFTNLGANTVTLSNTGGTDHLSFDGIGLPGFQFIQDEIDYDTRTHHTNMDTYDRLQAEDLKQASVIMASFVYNTAIRENKMPRKTISN